MPKNLFALTVSILTGGCCGKFCMPIWHSNCQPISSHESVWMGRFQFELFAFVKRDTIRLVRSNLSDPPTSETIPLHWSFSKAALLQYFRFFLWVWNSHTENSVISMPRRFNQESSINGESATLIRWVCEDKKSILKSSFKSYFWLLSRKAEKLTNETPTRFKFVWDLGVLRKESIAFKVINRPKDLLSAGRSVLTAAVCGRIPVYSGVFQGISARAESAWSFLINRDACPKRFRCLRSDLVPTRFRSSATNCN